MQARFPARRRARFRTGFSRSGRAAVDLRAWRRRRPRTSAAQGPQGAPQGIDALMGTQRLMRQRVNRVHLASTTLWRLGLDARPYSLTEPNPPDSGLTEALEQRSRAVENSPSTTQRQDIFYINFGGTGHGPRCGSLHGSDTGGKTAISARTMSALQQHVNSQRRLIRASGPRCPQKPILPANSTLYASKR